MKLLMMGLVAIVLLGGGGAGAYFFLLSPAEAAVDEGAVDEHVAAAEVHHDPSHFEFVQLDPLILPIVDENGVNQVVSMSVVLEVIDHGAAENVKRLTPRLKDAFIQDMYGVLNKHAALKGGVIQVNHIKQRLNKISHAVMGENQVNDVLLQVVQQRPI